MNTPRTPPKVRRPEPAPIAQSPALASLRERLDTASGVDRRETLLTEFWEAHPVTPLVEAVAGSDESIVTFLWRDRPDRPAEQVLLFVNRITDERDLDASLMERLPGTDLWHLSYRMRDDWRASYSFQLRCAGETWPWSESDQVSIRHALDRGLADPRNPLSCPNRAGTRMSVVELQSAPPQPWLAYRPDLPARGRVTRYTGPDQRTVWIYDPPVPPPTGSPRPGDAGDTGAGAADPTAHPVLSRPRAALPTPIPVVVLFDGEVWAGQQGIATTLDNLIVSGAIRPCLVVMPDSGGRERRWADLDADGSDSTWVVDRLLPWLRSLAPVSLRPDDIVVAGQSLGGYAALRCALEHPDVVGAVLTQSASLWQRELYTPASGLVHRLHAYIEVGRQEWVLREPNRALADAFAAAGADVHYVEYNGGHDYACWRGGIADGLRALIGPPMPRERGFGYGRPSLSLPEPPDHPGHHGHL